VCWVALKSKIADMMEYSAQYSPISNSKRESSGSHSASTSSQTLTAQTLRNSFTSNNILYTHGANTGPHTTFSTQVGTASTSVSVDKLADSRHFLDRAKLDFGGTFSSRKVRVCVSFVWYGAHMHALSGTNCSCPSIAA
jgi:hypothetical protein